MAIQTDKNSYTIIFSVIMVAIVGSVLAIAATGLKDRIDENRRFEKQQNILYAMGVNANLDEGSVNFVPTDEVSAQFDELITGQYVIVDGKAEPREGAYTIDLKKELDKLKAGQSAELPFFVGEREGKKYFILPMYGKGLWDAIWGYLSIDEDYVVQGVYFDHRGETPGLGANINMRFFMDDFQGESIYRDGKFQGLSVVKGNNDPLNSDKTDGEVDALAGATITGNGVTAMIKETVRYYQPYLQTLRIQ